MLVIALTYYAVFPRSREKLQLEKFGLNFLRRANCDVTPLTLLSIAIVLTKQELTIGEMIQFNSRVE